MEACLEDIGANQKKLKAKMETNQEKAEAVAEHYKRVQRVEATNLLTAQQDQASNVLHRDSKGATYKETNGALEDRFRGPGKAFGNGI
jgi:hypothetical protein